MDTKPFRESGYPRPIVRCRYVIAYFIAGTLFHSYAYLNSLYWTYRWLDMVVHFLGGVFLALLFFCIFSSRLWASKFDYRKSFAVTFLFCLGFVALLGIGWEIFEFAVNHMQVDGFDTLSDLLFDLGGGALIALLAYRRNHRTKKDELLS